MRRFLSFLVVLPFAILIVAFAVANRAPVTVDLWPLPYAVDLSLAAVVLLCVFVGILAGGAAAWISAFIRRREIKARAHETEMALRREADALRARLAEAQSRLPATTSDGDGRPPLPPMV